MQFTKGQWLLLGSFLCVLGVFFITNAFQSMAYWENGNTWYWIGVSVTYGLGVLGFILLSCAIKDKPRRHKKGKTSFFVPVIAMGLVIGFIWTTFIIIAGLSGV
ncbi:MAG TPA: hypothetical protein VIG63_04475 [Savagea sp.]